MKQVFRFILRLRWPLLLLVILAMLFEWVVSTVGYPSFVRAWLANMLNDDATTLTIGELRGEPFTNMKVNAFTYELRFQDKGRLVLRVPEADMGFRRTHLLYFRPTPRAMKISNGMAMYFHKQAERPSIFIQDINLDAEHSLLDVLRGSLTASLHNTALQLDFELRHGSLLYDTDSSSELNYELLGQILAKVADSMDPVLKNMSIGLNDAFVSATLTGDLSSPSSLQLIGDATFQDCILYSTSIPKIRCAFSYRQGKLNLSRLQCLLSSEELLTAEAEIDLKKSEASARLEGAAYPATVITLCGGNHADFPAFILMSQPVSLTAEIPRFSFRQPDTFKANTSFSCKNILLEGIAITDMSGRASYDAGEIALDALNLKTSAREQSLLNLQGNYNIASGIFTGKITGTLSLQSIINQLGYGSTNVMARMLPQISLELDIAPSPLMDWQKWNASLNAHAEQWQTGNIAWNDLDMQCRLDQCRLTLESLSMHLSDTTENTFCLHAGTTLTDWLSNSHDDCKPVIDKITGEVSLQIKQGAQEACNAGMTFSFKHDNGLPALSLDNGSASVRPLLLRTILDGVNELPKVAPLYWLQCNGDTPLTSAFSMSAWHPTLGTKDLKINGKIEASQITLLEVPLKRLVADYAFDTEAITLSNLHGLVENADTDVHITSLGIQYSPLVLDFENLTLDGHPETIEPWLYNSSARSIYNTIWKDVHWEEGSLPHISIPSLQYHELARNAYEFLLRGQFQSRNATYRNFNTRQASCSVNMRLPYPGVQLSDIVLCTSENAPLTGNATISFLQGVSGSFSLAFPEGELDTVGLLRNVVKPDNAYLPLLDLDQNTHFACTGTFSYKDVLQYNLTGKLQTPHLKYRTMAFDDLNCDWTINNNSLRWNVPSGKFYDGQLATTGEFNFSTACGECIASVRHIPIKQFSDLFKNKEEATASQDETAKADDSKNDRPPSVQNDKPQATGFAGCDARFRFYRNWAGWPLQLQGSARLEIHEGDLWRVPLLTSLGKLLLSNDLGRISKLDADVLFQGRRIAFTNIVTDGTLISLRGMGNYYLDDRQMQFFISGEFARSNRFFNWLLAPLSWMVKAELYGTPDNFSWRATAIRKLFTSASDYNPNKLTSELNDEKK